VIFLTIFQLVCGHTIDKEVNFVTDLCFHRLVDASSSNGLTQKFLCS
jgi:hypothetical protein